MNSRQGKHRLISSRKNSTLAGEHRWNRESQANRGLKTQLCRLLNRSEYLYYTNCTLIVTLFPLASWVVMCWRPFSCGSPSSTCSLSGKSSRFWLRYLSCLCSSTYCFSQTQLPKYPFGPYPCAYADLLAPFQSTLTPTCRALIWRLPDFEL